MSLLSDIFVPVRFSLTRNQTITNGQVVTGEWLHGVGFGVNNSTQRSIGDVLGPLTKAGFDVAQEKNLDCALFDGKGKLIKKIPLTITNNSVINQWTPWAPKRKTEFSIVVDTTDIQKGPGYIRLRSGMLDIGVKMPVVFQ